MSQNNSSQQFGVGNMQMWQQQLVFKQIQELQRQQQLQQLDQGARQQNLQSHSSVTSKAPAANQLPSMMNEMPINNTSNFMWVNNFAGGMPTISNNSQLVNTGNMDWMQSSGSPAIRTLAMHNVTNGLMVSNEQNQITRSMGYVPPQTDQSFYGMPVSGSRLYGNQYSQLSGDSTNLMTDRSACHTDKASEPFNSFHYNQNFPSEGPLQERNSNNSQNIQGKSFYGSSAMVMLNGDPISGNFQQVSNNVQMSIPVQNSQSTQDFYSQEEPVGTSGSALDPTEQKFLYGTDEDDNWGTSFSGSLGVATGDYQHSYSLDNGYFGGFPSIQSGSLSALMQEVVQASSSDKVLQEEWSGLSLQTEQTMLKKSVVSDDNGKQPTAWGDNHKSSASSFASRSLPPVNDASLGSGNGTPLQHSFISTGDEDKKIPNEDPNMLFRLSSGEDRNQQFSQVQKHKQLFESNPQVQTSASNGAWAVQSYQQQASMSADVPNLQGGWNSQQKMVPMHTTNFYENSGNIWKNGKNIGNLNSEEQSLKLNVGSSKMITEDPICNSGPLVSSNTMKLNQQIKQHVADSRQVVFGTNFSLNSSINDKDENAFRIKNQTHQMPEIRDRSFTDSEKGLAAQKKIENQNDISRETNVPDSLSDGLNTNMANVAAAQDSSTSTSCDQNSFNRGNQKSRNESGHLTMASKLAHTFASIGSNPQLSLPLGYQSNLSGLPNSRNEEQRHAEKSNSTGNVQNAALLRGVGMDVVERNTNSAIATGSFTGSASQHFQSSKNAYSSQNMLELLHKVDQSKNFVAGPASDVTGYAVLDSESSHHNQSTAMQGYGLRLAPPAQRQSLPNYGFPQTINDANSRQLDKETGSKDQAGSDAAQSVQSYNRVACHRDIPDNISNMSKQKHKATQDIAGRSTFSDVPHAGGQMEDQNQKRQHLGSSTRNQVEPQLHQQVKHSSNSPGQETFSSAGVASANTNPVTDSGFYSADGGARTGLHPSVSGLSQQPGSSKMLHSLWGNISAQQRLAGIQPHKLTPQLLQSIINSGKSPSFRGLQREVNQVKKGENVSLEAGRSPSNLQNEENEIRGESSSVAHSEKVAAASEIAIASHWQERDNKAQFDRASNASLSSLVHQHQQDVDRSKMGEDPSISTPQMLAPATANASSNSHIGVSRRMLSTSSPQQQNFSLLHQMQAAKDSDSDPSKVLGKRPRSADLGSSASQDWNKGQRFVYGQNVITGVPLERKDGVAQSLQSDHNMLSFVPKDKEKNESTSAGGHAGLPNQILPPPCSSNLVGVIERPQISPQMAPAWFEKNGDNANYEGQKISNVAAHSYFQSRVPGRKENSSAAQQITESCEDGSAGDGTSVPTISANESDHGMRLRAKKRKTATSDLLSWHKVVASGQRSFRSISMPEQEWSRAANRLMEQMEDEAESAYDSPSTSQPQKRLILTTKLMQHLLPASSYRMLKVNAADAYESLTFCVAKSALADAYSLIHSTDSSVCLDQNDAIPETLKMNPRMKESMLLKAMENFIVRSKKLENDFQRLDKRTSLLDVRLECQENERFSIVNRLGKFHGRPPSEGAENTSTSEAAARRTFPQRYVNVVSAPGNLPDGVPCLSL